MDYNAKIPFQKRKSLAQKEKVQCKKEKVQSKF